jgi:hypothetical protein
VPLVRRIARLLERHLALDGRALGTLIRHGGPAASAQLAHGVAVIGPAFGGGLVP